MSKQNYNGKKNYVYGRFDPELTLTVGDNRCCCLLIVLMDMLLSMTALAITTYSIILLHPSLRESTNVLSGECNEDKRNLIWNRLPKCLPKNETIAIPFPPDPNVIQYFPNRIELPRCSGACYENGHLYQSCKANETVLQDVPVILETISGQSTVEVCSTVKLEVHVSCSCGCGDIECNELQEFNERSCSCICKNSSVRGQCMAQYNKIWDENSCTCRCRQDQWKKCNTGYEYDGIYTCQCLPGQVINRASLGLIVTLVVVVVVLFGYSISMSQCEEEKGLADDAPNDQ